MVDNDHGNRLPTRENRRIWFSPVFRLFCGGFDAWRMKGVLGRTKSHPPDEHANKIAGDNLREVPPKSTWIMSKSTVVFRCVEEAIAAQSAGLLDGSGGRDLHASARQVLTGVFRTLSFLPDSQSEERGGFVGDLPAVRGDIDIASRGMPVNRGGHCGLGNRVTSDMKVNLEGKVALVTGASHGIGQAIATTLAANGARLVFADIDFDGAKHAASEVKDGLPLRMDVGDPIQVEAAIEQTVKSFGRLDILVNNAGINTAAHRVNIDQFPLAEWERILRVDLTGVFLVSSAGARPMLQQKSGRIINIASVVGLVPLRLQSAYVAAKAGVANLTRSMALELAPHGVLVNAVAPGSIMTEGTRKLFYGPDGKFSDRVASMIAHIPLGRPGTTQEIANAVLFLAAPENSYVNGQVLTVDGGWTAGYTREC